MIHNVMPSIRDIQVQAEMDELRNSANSVILMTPAWSAYPKQTLRKLESLLRDLAAQNIRVFTVTEDDPAKNRAFADWIAQHDRDPLRLLPSIATGAGTLIVCRNGEPIHVEPVTWQMGTDQLMDSILHAIQS
ncbi:MAG: hypothetical protein U1F71_02890 [Verrucomicrobiaceae bacterium]